MQFQGLQFLKFRELFREDGESSHAIFLGVLMIANFFKKSDSLPSERKVAAIFLFGDIRNNRFPTFVAVKNSDVYKKPHYPNF